MSVTALRTNGRKAPSSRDPLGDLQLKLIRDIPRTRRALRDANPRSLARIARVLAKLADYDAWERESKA